MDTTTMTVRLSNDDKNLITRYAKVKGLSVSDLVRESVVEHIEDEIDLDLYRQAMREYRQNPVTYSFEEIANEIGLEV